MAWPGPSRFRLRAHLSVPPQEKHPYRTGLTALLCDGLPLAAAVLIGVATLGCTCSRDDAQKAAEKPARAAPEKPALPPSVDRQLLSELRTAAEECKKGPRRITCSGERKNAIVSTFNRGERDKSKAVPTFAYALSLGEENLSALSAAVLYGSFRLGLGSHAVPQPPKLPSPQDATALFKGALALPPQASMQAIPAGLHAMVLTGQGPAVHSALNKELPIQVRTMALRYLMVYGRLEAFAEIQKAAKEPGAAVVLAAVESPRNMRDWTEEERARICPWLREFLEDERQPIAGSAMAGLSNCAAEDIDALLRRADKAIKEGQFNFIHSTALRNLCGKTGESRGSAASEEQCKQVRALQTKAAREDRLGARVRAMNLSNLAYDYPDEETLALAKQLSETDAPELRAAAEQAMKRIESRRSLQ